MASGDLTGTGIRYIPVVHTGQPERVAGRGSPDRRAGDGLVAGDSWWTDAKGDRASEIELKDVLIVAAYNAQVGEIARRLPGRSRRHGRQVPGPGGADLDLLDGQLNAGRRAARHGVPLQPQPAERGNVAGAVHGGRRREPGADPGPGEDAPPDATGQRVVSVRGAGSLVLRVAASSPSKVLDHRCDVGTIEPCLAKSGAIGLVEKPDSSFPFRLEHLAGLAARRRHDAGRPK